MKEGNIFPCLSHVSHVRRQERVRAMFVMMLVVMTTLSVFGNGDEASSSSGDEGEKDSMLEEFPNRAKPGPFIDPSDILNFDPASRTMQRRNEEAQTDDMIALEELQRDLIQCRQNLAALHEKTLIDAMYDKNEAHDKIGMCKKEVKSCQADLSDCKLGCKLNQTLSLDDSAGSPCKLEEMFFRRFAKKFINMLIQELKNKDDGPLAAQVRVKLSDYDWTKLRQFVQQKGKIKLVDAYDLMVDMLVSSRHDNIEHTGWLEKMTGMDADNIKFYALLIILSILVVVFESRTKTSWWQQLTAVMFVLFLISVGWNWIFLYKERLALKISKMEKHGSGMPEQCHPKKMTWMDSLREVVRKQMTLQEDPCDDYHKDVLVDPIYEVPPTRAISHTVSIMFMEPLKPLGKYIADFHRELLRDLPFGANILALLTVYFLLAVVVMVFCYCPRRGRGRDDAAWQRIRELEDRLHEQRRERLQNLENPRPNVLPVVELLPQVRPAGDNGLQLDVRQGGQQCNVCNRHITQALSGEGTPARVKQRRPHLSSESALQQRSHQRSQQRPVTIRDRGACSTYSEPYHGDDSSDDMDDHAEKPIQVGHLEGATRFGSSRNSPSKGTSSKSRKTEIQRQPIDCPNSELDSMEPKPDGARKKDLNMAAAAGQGRRLKEDGSSKPAAKSQQVVTKPAVGTLDLDKDVAKIRTKKSAEVTDTVSSSVTPASSTDSEPFIAPAPGCDSPSSVSVIEGDLSPTSRGSLDSDAHLQGLGMSLSGSIDIIEPLGVAGGEEQGNKSEDGQESDEFEVLSREQLV